MAMQQWRRRSDGAELDRQRLEGEAESERLRLRLATVQDRPPPTPPARDTSDEAASTALGTPRAKRRDDLRRIRGIGPVIERSLNELGIESWEQIANLTKSDIERLTAAIAAFPGRIERDDWVGSARRLLAAEQAADAQSH
jgi:predicted flap endonuclease-1-like 5' DNA nuclease